MHQAVGSKLDHPGFALALAGAFLGSSSSHGLKDRVAKVVDPELVANRLMAVPPDQFIADDRVILSAFASSIANVARVFRCCCSRIRAAVGSSSSPTSSFKRG